MLSVISIECEYYFFRLLVRRYVLMKVNSAFEVNLYDVRLPKSRLDGLFVCHVAKTFSVGEIIRIPIREFKCDKLGDKISKGDDMFESIVRTSVFQKTKSY